MDMRGKACLVIGGGKVAERKIKSLVDAGANVTVLSPDAAHAIQNLHKKKKIIWKKKTFSNGDTKGFMFVFCATNDKTVNDAVCKDAKKHHAFVNAADAPLLCDFFVPASFQKGSVSVAVSTEGKSPAFCAALKRKLQKDVSGEHAKLLELVHRFRSEIKKAIPQESRRTEFVSRLLQDKKMLQCIRRDDMKKAWAYIKLKIRHKGSK